MYFCGFGVCEGWVYMFIWLGCVRRVGMYWEGGRRETTPLYHICYIKGGVWGFQHQISKSIYSMFPNIDRFVSYTIL